MKLYVIDYVSGSIQIISMKLPPCHCFDKRIGDYLPYSLPISAAASAISLRRLSGEMELPAFYEEVVSRTGYAAMLSGESTSTNAPWESSSCLKS